MRKTLIAAAVLGATVAAHAEQTTQIAYPYAMPFVYTPVAYAPVAPLQVDEAQAKAYVEYQQKAHEQYLAYQRQVQASTPEFLRIPAVPALPALNVQTMRDVAAESEQMRAAAEADNARRAAALTQSMTAPLGDLDKTIAEREKELDAALAGMQQRLDERQKVLDVTAEQADTL